MIPNEIMSKKEIEKQINILEKSIEEMISLDKKLIPFKLNKAKQYTNQIKELFTQLISKGYIRIESRDLDGYCKESLDKWDKVDYFINKNKKSNKFSTFQQVFYQTKPQKTTLILGCSLYLMIFENMMAQFDDGAIIRIFADLKNKQGISIGCYISAFSKIEVLKRFNKLNSEFFDELDRNLRNNIGHFNFQISNNKLVYGKGKLTKRELREKTKKILWLSHIILLNKDLAIREYLLKF